MHFRSYSSLHVHFQSPSEPCRKHTIYFALFVTKKIKTNRALMKHCDTRHEHSTLDGRRIKYLDESGTQVDIPKLRQLDISSSEYNGYILIDFLQLTTIYFEHFVSSLNAGIDSKHVSSHRRTPFYARHTKRWSYKQYDMATFICCLEEQGTVTIKKEILCSAGFQEFVRPQSMTIEEEIEAATQSSLWSTSKRAISHVSLEVGVGQGRRTREVEVI